MSLFRVFVDGKLFYHPHLSQLAITQAEVSEDADYDAVSVLAMAKIKRMDGDGYVYEAKNHASGVCKTAYKQSD